MNEDETFERLKKVTFEQMRTEFQQIAAVYGNTRLYSEWTLARFRSAKERGWTVAEWQKENFRRSGQSDG